MTKPQSAPEPATDAPRRRSRAGPGVWATLRDNALVAVLGVLVTLMGSALVGLTIFAFTSLDRGIDRLEDQVIAGFAAQDAKIEQLESDIDAGFAAQDAKIGELDDKIHRIDLRLTALIARLEESGTIRAPGDGTDAAGT